MNRPVVLAIAAGLLAACSSDGQVDRLRTELAAERMAVADLETRLRDFEAGAHSADFHRIVAETNFITVSRWHPGVGIDVHAGFSFACSEITCRSADSIRASSYFSQILSETGVDREIEVGGVRVVEGHFEPGQTDRTGDWRFLGAWMDHAAAVLEHQFTADYPYHWYQSGAFGRLPDTLPAEGSATWRGAMIGADIVTNDRYTGTANLAVTFAADFREIPIDLSFTGITNVATGEARGDISFADVNIQFQDDRGRFSGWSGGEWPVAPIYVEGHTAGPDHAEAAGVFGYNELVGGFVAGRDE